MPTSEADVLIVGAGITGLTLALALARLGRSSHVVEAAPALETVGAGISLPPNATRLFGFLGLDRDLAACADRPDAQAILHHATGRRIALVDREIDEADRTIPFLQLHRATLIDLLERAVRRSSGIRLSLGRRATAVRPDDGAAVAGFADGTEIRAALVAGCDGVKSIVRESLFGPTPARFTGQVAFRCVIPADRAQRFMGAGPSALFIGPDAILNRYSVSGRTLVNCIAIVRTDIWREEGWSTPSSYEEVAAALAGWHEDVLGLFRAARPGELYKWALVDRPPLPRWSEQAVGLAGDAAHPMLPFMGMGAALGMEDAVVLGRIIAGGTPATAVWPLFERLRRDRCDRAQQDSRKQGQLYQSGAPEAYGATDAFELRRGYMRYDATRVGEADIAALRAAFLDPATQDKAMS